jgi:hypothetical protein
LERLSIKILKQESENLGIDHKTIGSFALIFLSLGCIPAYFDFMFCAIALWMIGFAIMNIHVFVLSRSEFSQRPVAKRAA